MNVRSFFRVMMVVALMLAVSVNANAQLGGALKSAVKDAAKEKIKDAAKEKAKEKVNEVKEDYNNSSSSPQEETTESQPSGKVNASSQGQKYNYEVIILNNTGFFVKNIVGRANGAPDNVTTPLKNDGVGILSPSQAGRETKKLMRFPEKKYSVYDDAVLVNLEMKVRKESENESVQTEGGETFQTVRIPLPFNIVPKEGAKYTLVLTGTDPTNFKLEDIRAMNKCSEKYYARLEEAIVLPKTYNIYPEMVQDLMKWAKDDFRKSSYKIEKFPDFELVKVLFTDKGFTEEPVRRKTHPYDIIGYRRSIQFAGIMQCGDEYFVIFGGLSQFHNQDTKNYDNIKLGDVKFGGTVHLLKNYKP